jgi:hypothetical protein
MMQALNAAISSSCGFGAPSLPSSWTGSSATILWLRDALAADREAVDNGFTARLSGPAGSDVERHQGLAGVLPDALDDLAKRFEINPVDRGVLHFVQHVIFLV